jgi:hypothetical protein
MSIRVFYHNISKEIMNETDLIDFMNEYDLGNICYKSEAGNALMIKLDYKELTEMTKEHNEYYRENFPDD